MYLNSYFSSILATFYTSHKGESKQAMVSTGPKIRKNIVTKVLDAVKALALCHNVTPVFDTNDISVEEATEADQASVTQANIPPGAAVTYQASSPDEVALVEWSEQMGLALVDR